MRSARTPNNNPSTSESSAVEHPPELQRPEVTAGGVAVNEETRGTRAQHEDPNRGAHIQTSGAVVVDPEQLPVKHVDLSRDGSERELNKPIQAREVNAPVQKFLVTRGGTVVGTAGRTTLREGKIVDTLNYDVNKLKQQGILLRPLSADEATSGAY